MVELEFEGCGNVWKAFVDRPDAIFGVTFMYISTRHPRLDKFVSFDCRERVDEYLERVDEDGVFSGSYVVNPANGESIPVWVVKFENDRYMEVGVPSHNHKDFEFARKNGIGVKQVVAPLFLTTEGPDAVRDDKETIKRKAVFGVVKHWERDEYYCLDWKKFGWKSLVIGGVDEGEAPEEAVAREVREETGYQDIVNVRPVSIEMHSSFFARHKDVNRYGKFRAFLVELGSGEWIEPNPEDVKNHDGEWVKREDVEDYLNLENNSYVWNNYVNGESAYTDSGVLINSGKFDGMNSDEVGKKIVDWLSEGGVGR